MAEEEQKYSPTYRDELAITRYFVSVLEQQLAGRDNDTNRRTNIHPLDWCHLGVIGPAKSNHAGVSLEAASLEAEVAPDGSPETSTEATKAASRASSNSSPAAHAAATEGQSEPADAEDGERTRERVEDQDGVRRPPSAIGFEALLSTGSNGTVELSVDVEFCVFTKHLPSFQEQSTVLESGASAGAPLAEVVQRWSLKVQDIRFTVRPGDGPYDDGGAVQRAIDAALAAAFSSPDAERELPGARPKVSGNDLKSPEAFKAFLDARMHNLQPERWSIAGSVEIRAWPRDDGKVRVGCYLKNETPETPPLTKGRGMKDAFKVISDVRIKATLATGELYPIEILPVPQDYQYDRRVWAVGHNTSVVVDREARTVRTAALAVYEQPRIMTRDAVPAKFTELSVNPFQTLDAIYEAMGAYANDWEQRVLGQNALGLDVAALAECRKDYEGFVDEIRRFACGAASLKADPRLLQAFQAANRVFGKLASGYGSWRLFQLVYIVTQLPALAVRENHKEGHYPDDVKREWSDVLDWGDVLWFRTGGGKTEAYLGLSCVAMLYDRLRGKRFGMTAWLRFPLRMLSIQQLQRAMRVIWETEQERKSLLGEGANQSAPIRLGYFVGSATTPNSISHEYLSKQTPESLEKLRAVPDCPACGGKGTVKVHPDLDEIRFQHICESCGEALPLDITDDEVYRHLPALVVGTIDKMATVGMQQKFGMLWGGARWKCPQHGYGFGEYCTVFGCKVPPKERKNVKPYDGAPALHIQDELHLLQEELGAFAGHYETLIRYCESTVGGRPSKVIAATATIEGFVNQVRHLYGVKNARRFPGRGYDKMESFYAVPDRDGGTPKTARVFVAFKSQSLSPADASALSTEILQTEIGKIFEEPSRAIAFLHDAKTDEDVRALLRHYTTTLNYVGSLPRGSRVRQALEAVASKVRPGPDARELNVEYLSGRSSSAEVAEVVHRVEGPPDWKDESFLDALVATSMISHGVDLERANLMTMDGVPEEVAEYIQASSRSGRRHVGLVVVVLSNFSLRASSIYHRFIEYHQHLDRMVSPVPVNRFAKYAAQRTLPGVAMGVIFGIHAATAGTSRLNQRASVANLLDELGDKFVEEVEHAYSLGDGIYDGRLEGSLTAVLKDQLGVFELAVRNSNEKLVMEAVRPRPMTSLRDVESGVAFWPDHFDARLLHFVRRNRE